MSVDHLLLQSGDTLRLNSDAFVGGLLLESSTPMADRIEIQFPQTLVQEETTFTATAYFRDRASKELAIPTTIHYKVVDPINRHTITDWTSIATPAGSNTITITTTENKIRDDANLFETKMLIVKADSGLSTQVIQKKTWRVQNLEGIGEGV